MKAIIKTHGSDDLDISFTLETKVKHLRALRGQLITMWRQSGGSEDLLKLPKELRVFLGTLDQAMSRADVSLGVDLQEDLQHATHLAAWNGSWSKFWDFMTKPPEKPAKEVVNG